MGSSCRSAASPAGAAAAAGAAGAPVAAAVGTASAAGISSCGVASFGEASLLTLRPRPLPRPPRPRPRPLPLPLPPLPSHGALHSITKQPTQTRRPQLVHDVCKQELRFTLVRVRRLPWHALAWTQPLNSTCTPTLAGTSTAASAAATWRCRLGLVSSHLCIWQQILVPHLGLYASRGGHDDVAVFQGDDQLRRPSCAMAAVLIVRTHPQVLCQLHPHRHRMSALCRCQALRHLPRLLPVLPSPLHCLCAGANPRHCCV